MSTLNEAKKRKPLTKRVTIKLLGVFYCLFVNILLLMSLPVYLFRVVVIFLAKLACPDFGDILNGQSALFVSDYLAETNPSAHLVLSMILEGQFTMEKVQELVLKNWISNKELVKLQQYPVKWMGFTFWKKITKPFHVNDYVQEHSGSDVQVEDLELDKLVETLLNRRTIKHQSPWELHLIQNYRNVNAENKTTGNQKPHSVLILKWHHCLMDGMGAGALLEGLFKTTWIRKLENELPPVSTAQKMLHYFTFPGKAFWELSSMLAHRFEDSPFKVPENRKEGYQVHARSGLIPIQLIKDIKNKFGVSYTSVLISAISSAVHKTGMQNSESVHFMSVLPALGISKRKTLSTQATSTMFDIPTTSFKNPVERLAIVGKLFEDSRRSVKPFVAQYVSSILGVHLLSINERFAKNRLFPIGLTNFAGAQSDLKVNDHVKWIHTRTVAGCLPGDGRIAITACSHGANTEIHLATDRAVMTRKQAQEFVYNIVWELKALGALLSEK